MIPSFLVMPVFPAKVTGVTTWANCRIDGVPTLKCLEIIYGNLIFLSSSFVLLILFVMFSIAGFNYLTSFGNPEKIKKAQATLRYVLYGFILYVSAFLIITLIDTIFLGGHGNLLRFQIPSFQ